MMSNNTWWHGTFFHETKFSHFHYIYFYFTYFRKNVECTIFSYWKHLRHYKIYWSITKLICQNPVIFIWHIRVYLLLTKKRKTEDIFVSCNSNYQICKIPTYKANCYSFSQVILKCFVAYLLDYYIFIQLRCIIFEKHL